MYRYTTPAHRLSGPSVVDSYLGASYQLSSDQQVSQWAAHRSALSTAVAAGRKSRRRRRTPRVARPTVPQAA